MAILFNSFTGFMGWFRPHPPKGNLTPERKIELDAQLANNSLGDVIPVRNQAEIDYLNDYARKVWNHPLPIQPDTPLATTIGDFSTVQIIGDKLIGMDGEIERRPAPGTIMDHLQAIRTNVDHLRARFDQFDAEKAKRAQEDREAERILAEQIAEFKASLKAKP